MSLIGLIFNFKKDVIFKITEGLSAYQIKDSVSYFITRTKKNQLIYIHILGF